MSEVIDIGALRVKRERERIFSREGCLHLHLTYDDQGETIVCDECKLQVTAYWAFGMLLREYLKWHEQFQREQAAFKEQTAKEIVLLAAKRVEKAWRSRSMLPSCPHCWRGIGPNDGFGNSSVNRAMEMRRRAEEAKAKAKVMAKEPSPRLRLIEDDPK